MRGTVAKRLRKIAFEKHQFDGKPSILERIKSAIRKSGGSVAESYQLRYSEGFRRTYRDLKLARRRGKEF